MTAISVDDFITFCHRTIEAMRDEVARFDDETINLAPELPGANSGYVIVHHALSACRWWTATVVCGQPSDRDRNAEFSSTGTCAQLEQRAVDLMRTLTSLRDPMTDASALTIDPAPEMPLDGPWTVGAALIHAYEELAQHLGHLQITADLVLADRS